MAKHIDDLVLYVRELLRGAVRVSGSSYVGKLRETQALKSYLEKAHLKYHRSDLVAVLAKTLLERLEGSFFDVIPATKKNLKTGKLAEDVMDYFPGDDDLRHFLYDLVECHVHASGSSLLGLGERVNAEEAAYLTELKGKLGVK
jgi:hypothetical protein